MKSELSITAKNIREQFKAFDFQKSSHGIIIIEKDLLIYRADSGQYAKFDTGSKDSHG